MKLNHCVSGLQEGADLGFAWACKNAGIKFFGYMPKNFKNETGRHWEFQQMFNAIEMPTEDYPPRTRKNVESADATIWFGQRNEDSLGKKCTLKAVIELNKKFYCVMEGQTTPRDVVNWIITEQITSINGAGSRESKSPGLCVRVQNFMDRVFNLLECTI